MGLEEFLLHVKEYKIPPEPPDDREAWVKRRCICNERGMWAIVDRCLAQRLAEWIDGRKVLEIMAGAGWLAKALQDEGVDIVPTDNGDWDKRHSKMIFLTGVEKLEAADAVKTHTDAEVLLVSWPPYGEDAVVKACELWGDSRPIVYIGEGEGGCNAPDEFFQHFVEDKHTDNIPIARWDGLHDSVWIGHWRY